MSDIEASFMDKCSTVSHSQQSDKLCVSVITAAQYIKSINYIYNLERYLDDIAYLFSKTTSVSSSPRLISCLAIDFYRVYGFHSMKPISHSVKDG